MTDPPMAEESVPVPHTSRLILQLGAAGLARMVVNTSRRFVYPFASALGRGLGVPLTAITSLAAVNQATGVFSLALGPLGDRWGYRVMMLIGLSLVAGGMLAGGLFPAYGVLLLAALLAGLGKSVYDPALLAYVGEQVPYRRRGLAVGMIEFAWAGSALIGVPLAGLLIERMGWRWPFLALGGLGLLGIVALRILIPGDGRGKRGSAGQVGFRQAWRLLSRERAAWGALGFSLLFAAANDNLFAIYGTWLESGFGLSVAAVGAATTIIGVAELLGEGLTASLADRLGLKRALIVGLLLSALSYALLPWLEHTLWLSLAGLFVVFIAFEFTIVSSLSLFTELLPGARATMMASILATAGVGRVIGALASGPVWLAGGMPATGLVSAAVSLLALAWLAWGLREPCSA